MAKVKTITLNGKASEYDVQFTKAYVAKIISAQSDLYQELIPGKLPYNAIKEIYVDGTLRAELIGSQLHTVTPERKPKHDHMTAGCDVGQYVSAEELFDESHALDMVLNDMLDSMTEEELDEFYGVMENDPEPTKGIYLQSISTPPPYWVSDTTAGNLEINYSTENI